MSTIMKVLLVAILGVSILLAGCSVEEQTPIVEDDENNSQEQDINESPVNETFEESTVDENDDVEIGELI